MAEFTSDFQSFRTSFPFLDIDHMELINQFKGENSILNMQNFMMPFSSDTFLGSLEPEFPENFSAASVSLPISSPENETHHYEGKKRKATDMCGASSENSTPAVSESKQDKIKNSSGRGKKKVKRNGTEDEKSKEVVHVRARRGQATDSHSLAERVRRGKINEKLRCLQNIVPGCYKTMGMAIMLDEIINYVQSLQNQVEFLSMKLTAASSFYDFNSETDALETLQRGRALEAKELGKYMREGCEGVSCFQSTWF